MDTTERKITHANLPINIAKRFRREDVVECFVLIDCGLPAGYRVVTGQHEYWAFVMATHARTGKRFWEGTRFDMTPGVLQPK